MSIIKHPYQRVGVFIDTQNLYHSARNLFDCYVNFGAVLDAVVDDRQLIRSIAYVISTENGDEQNFFDALTKAGIETRTKDIQIFIGGVKKADWDVGMAVEAITLANNLDAVILVTGDGDFVPLVKYLQVNSGVQVEVASFAKSSSARLIEAADDFLDLAQDPKRFLLNFRRKRRTKSSSKSTNPKTRNDGGERKIGK